MILKKSARVLVFALSASSAAAAVEVTFHGGRTLTAESVKIEGALAVLTLPGGGTLAVQSKRILALAEIAEVPASGIDSAGEDDGASPPGDSPVEEGGKVAAPVAGETAPAGAGTPPVPPGIPPGPAPTDIPALVEAAALRYGVDVELLRCLIEVESGLDPNAVSPKGAMGLAQLMPGTARELGVVNPFDPAESVDAAARHLRDLLEQSGGRFVPALAAYNAGRGAVARYGGLPPYRETIMYIERILRLYATP